jgi:hypothetical protein
MSDEKIKGTSTLKEALLDAERLLAHASEYGIEIDQKYIRAIINAKKNNQKNEWAEQDEIDFWVAFQVLAKAVEPVSIDSLRASSVMDTEKRSWWSKIWGTRKKSMVERSVSFYRRFALIAMIGMLALQIYALIGTALMSKWNSGNERMIEIEQRMQSLLLITSANPEDRTAQMEQTNLEMELGELDEEVASSIHLLNDWLDVTYNFWSKSHEEIQDFVAKKTGPVSGPPVETGTHDASVNVYVVQQAKSLIIIFNQYILPLLYGLLGGFAFVLRSLAEESRKMTYTSTSKIKYGLRIHLGALAGLVIGFLWGDFQGKSFGVVESLSPLAVAFLAGYSVDFLFRMLDSLIANTGKKPESGGSSNEKKEKK